MSQRTANILVFDSGVGGLSIVNPIRQRLPATTLTYLADNKLFPYGLLDEQLLIERVTQLIANASQQYHADIVVVACNSASTLALPHLREVLNIPVVGVVPAIKPAAQQSKSKVIGLLATPGTIQRDYTDDLIGDFANGCDIIRVGTSTLVNIVEEKLAGITPAAEIFTGIIALFHHHPRWQQMDTIVLACTHFPLVIAELAQAAPEIDHWIDAGDAIARRVQYLLENLPDSPVTADPETNNTVTNTRNIALFTDTEKLTAPLKQSMLAFGFSQTENYSPLYWPNKSP
ncbi:MAG: glutamate racemase [Pseudomonadales bacterium]